MVGLLLAARAAGDICRRNLAAMVKSHRSGLTQESIHHGWTCIRTPKWHLINESLRE